VFPSNETDGILCFLLFQNVAFTETDRKMNEIDKVGVE
jgi:hypothetical protein